MKRRFPPLNSLKAFESAARHQSFKKAANELYVTPAAISKQIKVLEDYLGEDVFIRHPNSVELKEHARDFHEEIQKAFASVHSAVEKIYYQKENKIILIKGYRTFLMKWVLPRSKEFELANPGWKVKLLPIDSGMRLEAPSDIEIRYGRGLWTRTSAELLFKDEMVVACSPDYLEKHARKSKIINPEEILKLKIIALKARENDWLEWFVIQGLDFSIIENEVEYFNDLAVVMEYARSGFGVILIQKLYIEDDIAKNNLIIISDKKLERNLGYYALFDEENKKINKCLEFVDLLKNKSTSESEIY